MKLLMRVSYLLSGFVIMIAAMLLIANVLPKYKKGEKQMQEIEINKTACDSNNLKLTLIYDNYPFKEGMETSWGFSCLITGAEKTILFDTGGDGSLLLENMSKLAIEPDSIELITLSHAHWDHIDGLEMFLGENSNVTVFMLESFPDEFKEKVTSAGAKIIEIEESKQICPGIYSTGQLGTSIKEQGLIIRTEKGLILITGCAHPGIVKMVQKTKELFNENFLFVIGGFHLNATSDEEIENIIDTLQGFNIKYLSPCHCTGDNAIKLFKEHFGEKYLSVGVGKIIEIKEL